MANQFAQCAVTAFIDEQELKYLQWLARQKPNTATGGDVFGYWHNGQVAMMQLVLGSGKKCKRTATSFQQDRGYSKTVRGHLKGLCYLGEWTSHHKLNLAEPSEEERITAWSQTSSVDGEKFLFVVTNITGSPTKVKVGVFLFDLNEKKIERGIMRLHRLEDPVRQQVTSKHLTSGAESGQDWETFLTNDRTPMFGSPSDHQRVLDKYSVKRKDRLKVEKRTANERNASTNATDEDFEERNTDVDFLLPRRHENQDRRKPRKICGCLNCFSRSIAEYDE